MNTQLGIGQRTALALGVVASALVLVLVDANDARQNPPTDSADVIATFTVLGGVAAWIVVRRLAFESRWGRTVTALLAGMVVGCLIVGLGSVLWNPFHR